MEVGYTPANTSWVNSWPGSPLRYFALGGIGSAGHWEQGSTTRR